MTTKLKQPRGRIRRRCRRVVTATTPGVDRPQPDPWLALFPPGTAIIAKDENQPGLQIPLLALEDEIDSDFNEIRFAILPGSPSQLWERVAQEVEDFCVGFEFVLQNCVTVASAPSQIQDSLHQTRLYEMLKRSGYQKDLQTGPIYHSRRIYINHPDGPCILSLIKTAPLSPYQGYRELLANYLTTTPEPRIRVYDSDMWNGCFIILFNLPCLAIIYEDWKDTRTIGDRAELRHRFDPSFLISKNPTEVMRDEKRGKMTPRFLHEVNFSLMVTGKSDTYWTAVCLNEDSFERNPRLDAAAV
ncbi:hypothetical protein EDB80DRAFT_683756 [Ilyonectria destructans]|nr:hypothetical protein EDB80DRAFT_683756 [Ilyonectria destructans]